MDNPYDAVGYLADFTARQIADKTRALARSKQEWPTLDEVAAAVHGNPARNAVPWQVRQHEERRERTRRDVEKSLKGAAASARNVRLVDGRVELFDPATGAAIPLPAPP